MTEQTAAAGAASGAGIGVGVTPAVLEPANRLEPDAIGVVQDTVFGMASAAPAATMGLILASLAAATSYGSAPAIIVTAIPMIVIAFAYHRLNMWNANCGASFEWVGRTINPYLGWFTGWLMITGYVLGTISVIEVLGPSVLAVFGQSTTSTGGNVAVALTVGIAMLVLAVVGIRVTARTQVSIALIEYVILIGMSIWGMVWVLSHHAGTYHVTSSWFSLTGIGGTGSAAAGFFIVVFAFSGWDGALYVNEEVTHRRKNPGRAAIIGVVLLGLIFLIAQFGLQGVVSPAKLQANSAAPLVFVAQTLGGGGWAKLMALSLALSSIASTNAGIVLGGRIIYGMASYRALPEFLATVPRRFATPAAASILFGSVTVGLTVLYLVVGAVQNAMGAAVSLSGLLYALFYILTALASLAYYRRRVFSSVYNAIVLGILPLGAAGFLVWMSVKAISGLTVSEKWSLIGIGVTGLVLMVIARVVLKSPFFGIAREAEE